MALGRFGVGARGQAAITDALFLLVIVGILATTLFAFSSQYGNRVSLYLSDQYRSDYATTALKTVLYTSVPRDPSQTLFEAREVDYLLAAIKEDYADDQLLSPDSRRMLRNSAVIAMKPLDASFDYLLSLQRTGGADAAPFFIYLRTSNIVIEGGRCGERAPRGARVYTGDPPTLEYFCTARDARSIQSVLERLGQLSSSSSILRLNRVSGSGGGLEPVAATAALHFWPSACIPTSAGDVDGTMVIAADNVVLEELDWSQGPSARVLVCQLISQGSVP